MSQDPEPLVLWKHEPKLQKTLGPLNTWVEIQKILGLYLKDVITKVEVKLETETKLIIGINTLLDIVSITL